MGLLGSETTRHDELESPGASAQFSPPRRGSVEVECGGSEVLGSPCDLHDRAPGGSVLGLRLRLLGTLLLIGVCLSSPLFAGGLLWELDGSVGYLFVSDAQGTPWFSDTEIPSFALSTGGEAWSLGLSVGYASDSHRETGYIPGFTDTVEQFEKRLSNTCFGVFARIFPGGRERFVAPYLGLGLGPAITSVVYTGESTGREESDSIVRLCYAVSVGSKLRFGKSPFSAFFEGSFGGLGALPAVDEQQAVAAPRKALNYVCVAAGLGVTFR